MKQVCHWWVNLKKKKSCFAWLHVTGNISGTFTFISHVNRLVIVFFGEGQKTEYYVHVNIVSDLSDNYRLNQYNKLSKVEDITEHK